MTRDPGRRSRLAYALAALGVGLIAAIAAGVGLMGNAAGTSFVGWTGGAGDVAGPSDAESAPPLDAARSASVSMTGGAARMERAVLSMPALFFAPETPGIGERRAGSGGLASGGSFARFWAPVDLPAAARITSLTIVRAPGTPSGRCVLRLERWNRDLWDRSSGAPRWSTRKDVAGRTVVAELSTDDPSIARSRDDAAVLALSGEASDAARIDATRERYVADLEVWGDDVVMGVRIAYEAPTAIPIARVGANGGDDESARSLPPLPGADAETLRAAIALPSSHGPTMTQLSAGERAVGLPLRGFRDRGAQELVAGPRTFVSPVPLPDGAIVTDLRLDSAGATHDPEGAGRGMTARLLRLDARTGQVSLMIAASGPETWRALEAPRARPGERQEAALRDADPAGAADLPSVPVVAGALVDHTRFFYYVEIEGCRLSAEAGGARSGTDDPDRGSAHGPSATGLIIRYAPFGSGVDFKTQIRPLFTNSGCNGNGCHASAVRTDQTSNGLGLSASFSLVNVFNEVTNSDGLEPRTRVNVASPTLSLIVAYPARTGAGASHTGGTLWASGSSPNLLVRQWITEGALICPNDGDSCTNDVYDEANDRCGVPLSPGTVCDDGDVCTLADACSEQGSCTGALVTIAGISKTAGRAGSKITVNGTNLAGASAASFGGVASPALLKITPTSFKAVVPVGAVTGKVAVTFAGGCGLQSAATFFGTPSITSIEPPTGRAGTIVTIQGSNLTGTTQVLFKGNKPAVFTVLGNTSLEATVPEGAKSGILKIVTPGGKAKSTTPFTVETEGSGSTE